jgi:hypothetical protein
MKKDMYAADINTKTEFSSVSTRYNHTSTQQPDKKSTTPPRQTRLMSCFTKFARYSPQQNHKITTPPCSHPYVAAYVLAQQQQRQ